MAADSPAVGRPPAPTAKPIDLVVAGAAGRMGTRIVALARETAELRVVAALEAAGHRSVGADAGVVAGVGPAGVTIGTDATSAITAERVLVEFSIRAVIGTTGFSPAQRAEIAALAGRAAIMQAPNMSVAVTLAFKLLPIMARALGDDYDVEITEIHHRFKKDAPSGTAARMAELVAEALGRDLGKVGVYGREGLPGERTPQRSG
jgi:4-hydroxy-tetrahydrodipicolinate reductase